MDHSNQVNLNPNDILIKETAGLDIGAFKFLTLHPNLLPPMLRSYTKNQNELIFNSDNLFTNYLQSQFCEVETPLPNQDAIKELDRCVRSNNYIGRFSYFEGSNHANTTLDLPVLDFLNTRKKNIQAVGFVRQHAMLQGVDFEVHHLMKVFQPKKLDKKKLYEKRIKRRYTKRKKLNDPNNPNFSLGLSQSGFDGVNPADLKPEELEEWERRRKEKEDRELFSKAPIRRTPHSHRIPDLEVVRKRVFPKEDKQKSFYHTTEIFPCDNCGIIPTEVKPGNLCKRCFRQKERRDNILFQPAKKEEVMISRAERAQQRRHQEIFEEGDEEESEEEDLLNPSEIKETRVGSHYQAEIPAFTVARPNNIIKETVKNWGPDLLESKSYSCTETNCYQLKIISLLVDEVQEKFRKRVLESFKKLESARKEVQESSVDKQRKEADILIDQEITAKKLNDLNFDMNKFLNWTRPDSDDFESFITQHKTQKQARMKQFNVQKQLGK